MGLLKSVAILAIVVIIIIGIGVAALELLHGPSSHPITSSQAVQFVTSDLKQASPTANITVINVSESALKAGSWDVVVSLIYNSTSPCPTFLVEQFDYPAVTLVPSIEDLYTSACQVYGLSNAPSYIISAPPVAITRAYMLRNASIMNYITDYGYNYTIVHARFGSISANSTPLGMQFNDSWLINYSASGAKQSLYVVMDTSGTSILGTYTQNRTAQ
ncbi:hypothetical protein M1329_00410 [Candidatus Marsarchaeota archaeon]|nr:hypothetical protein [Candidatus Marsarchaeota archaeon]MCL5100148.1 hypothetical protein [Candidatus Marsarchaeota archaeon]